MPSQNETIGGARKVLPIIYVLDTSGSMFGEKIAAVNEAMHETTEVLRDISDKNPDAEVKIGALSFSSGAQWETNGLVFLEDFFWNDLTAAGVTDLGEALKELDSKLSRSAYLVSDTGFCVPVIIFMSDGQPTDNYEKALANINAGNKWFKSATKIAIAVGDDADQAVLAKVVGNSEAIIKVTDTETLKKLIKVVSATASMVGSKSRSAADIDPAEEIIRTTEKELGKEIEVGTDEPVPGVPAGNPAPAPAPAPSGGDSGWDDDDDWN